MRDEPGVREFWVTYRDPEFLEIETTQRPAEADRAPGARPRRARGGDQRTRRGPRSSARLRRRRRVGADLLRTEPGQAEELQPDRPCDAHDHPVGGDLHVDRACRPAATTPGRSRRRAAAPRTGSSRTSAPPLARYTRLVDRRRAGQRGAVGDVLQVAARGEEPRAVDREPDEEQAEEQRRRRGAPTPDRARRGSRSAPVAVDADRVRRLHRHRQPRDHRAEERDRRDRHLGAHPHEQHRAAPAPPDGGCVQRVGRQPWLRGDRRDRDASPRRAASASESATTIARPYSRAAALVASVARCNVPNTTSTWISTPKTRLPSTATSTIALPRSRPAHGRRASSSNARASARTVNGGRNGTILGARTGGATTTTASPSCAACDREARRRTTETVVQHGTGPRLAVAERTTELGGRPRAFVGRVDRDVPAPDPQRHLQQHHHRGGRRAA